MSACVKKKVTEIATDLDVMGVCILFKSNSDVLVLPPELCKLKYKTVIPGKKGIVRIL